MEYRNEYDDSYYGEGWGEEWHQEDWGGEECFAMDRIPPDQEQLFAVVSVRLCKSRNL